MHGPGGEGGLVGRRASTSKGTEKGTSRENRNKKGHRPNAPDSPVRS